jgi:3-oxoacyl-[acyl-carrier-protein] synthase-3
MKPAKKPSSPPRRSVSVVGTGAYLPERVMTNAELEKMVDTTDEWITTRTGIRERRIAAEGEMTSDLAARAAERALKSAGIEATAVDLIIVATATPDTIFPATACYVQHKIGATRAVAFDLTAACAGFLFAAIVGEQFIATGAYQTVLVIGAEKLSSILNWEDRNTCVLFGDGAGAVVLQHRPGSSGLRATDMGSDGAQTDILSLPAGGCKMPVTAEVIRDRKNFLQMSGKEVYRYAITAMSQSAERSLDLAGLKTEDIRMLIPHQANLRIIEAVADRLGLPMDKCYINLERYGNVSAACIPIALHEAVSTGLIKKGDNLLLVTFGGGLTWASAVLEW